MTDTLKETAMVTVFVHEVRDEDLPPIPDRSIADQYFKAGPGKGPAPREVNAGHYQYLTLDTRSGELRFRALPWHTGIDHSEAGRAQGKCYVGDSPAPLQYEYVPDVMHWVIDSGWAPLPYLTADQGNALARTVAPLAQDLVDGLVPITGTDRHDWSRVSISAAQDIHLAVQREPEPPLGPRKWLVEMAEAVAVLPEMVKPEFADLTDEQLEHEGDCLTRFAFSKHWYPHLLGLLGLDEEHRYDAKVIGTRAWLAAHRASAAAGRKPLDSDVWFSRPELGETAANLADCDDEQLRKLAEDAERAARLEGFKLLGTFSFLRTRRGRQRYELVQGLGTLGADFDAALDAYRNSRLRLYGRFAQIKGWQDPAYDNMAELARLSGQPRQAVARELAKLLGDPDAEDAAAQGEQDRS
jgi:hypothetical protein